MVPLRPNEWLGDPSRLVVLAIALLSCTGDARAPTAPLPPDQVTLDVTVSLGVTGTLASGRQSFPCGTRVDYTFPAAPGYANLRVSAGSSAVTGSGRLTLAQDAQFIAAADSVIPPSAAQDLLTDSYRGMLVGSDLAQSFAAMRADSSACTGLHDVHALRQALGASRISRWGHSYDSHLALAVPRALARQRYFPAADVASE